MTAAASQRLPFRPRWEQSLTVCPIGPALWTHCSDVSKAWTYFGDVSRPTSSLNVFRLAAAQREQMEQAGGLDEVIWANLEDIGYGG